jgi:hypothetical protein
MLFLSLTREYGFARRVPEVAARAVVSDIVSHRSWMVTVAGKLREQHYQEQHVSLVLECRQHSDQNFERRPAG